MLRTHVSAFALLAATLAVAGCGSSKTGTTSASKAAAPATSAATGTAATSTAQTIAVTVKIASGRPLPRTQWIAKGDAICTRFAAERDTLRVTSFKEIPRLLPELAAIERTEVAQLAKLVPPASMASDWQRFLDTGLQRAEATANVVNYVQLRQALPTITGIEEHFDQIAKHDGFKACSQRS